MKRILVKISSIKDTDISGFVYTHYVLLPQHPTYRYTITASKEGFSNIAQLWREAGYEILYENIYPE